jgi:hypothetical protein
MSMPLLALALASAPAEATQYAHVLDMDGLMESADRVVRGRVVRTHGDWTDGGYIETEVVIDVSETYLGARSPTLTVIAPGGAATSAEGESVELHIEGAARFEVGQEVVVFARGRTLVGFGQGAFRVEDGLAVRDLGNALPGASLKLDLDRSFGVKDEADTCLRNALRSGYGDGWSLRTAANTRLSPDEVGIFELTLIADTEYRLQACGDGLVEGADLMLMDAQGRQLVRSSGSRDPVLMYVPEETATYYIGMSVDGMPADVLRSALSVGISYR